MAPSHDIHTTQRNGHKPLIKPVLPALPFIVKSKKNASQGESSPVQSTDPAPPSDILSPATQMPRHHDGLNGNESSSAPSVSAPDESVSVKSSQDPNSIRDNDGSVFSAITSEFVEPFPTDLELSLADPIDTAKSDQTSTAHTERAEPVVINGSEVFAETQDVPQIESFEPAQATPDSTASIHEISPLTHLSNDQSPVELSAYSTPLASIFANVSVPPEVVDPMAPRRPGRKQHRSRSSSVRNGRMPATSVPTVFNNQHDPAAVAKPLPTVLEHLLYLSNSKELADWMIQIDQPGPKIQPFVTYAHAFVLLRSVRMRKLMAHPSDTAVNLPIIRITPSRTMQPHAFEAALRFLYSDTVLSPEALFPRDTYMDRHARAHLVDYVLSYWTAGIELGLEPVSSRAYALLAGMIDWDIAEFLVREVSALRTMSPIVSKFQPPTDVLAMADSILRLVFGLFIHRFDPQHFKLDVNNQSGTTYSRFAQLDLAKPSSNPVLAGMVFGSMPSTTEVFPSSSAGDGMWSADTTASLILLNLDFADLNNLSKEFVRTYGPIGAQILSDVVNEREKRRLFILNNKSISNKDRVANPAIWDIIGWHEMFQQGNLHRERVGYVLPSKKTKGSQLEFAP